MKINLAIEGKATLNIPSALCKYMYFNNNFNITISNIYKRSNRGQFPIQDDNLNRLGIGSLQNSNN